MFDLLKKLKMVDNPLWTWGIQRCFLTDEEQAAAGVKATEEKAATEAKEKEEAAAAAKAKAGPETFDVKIGGETKLLTLDELKEHATKAAGADQLMREASELRKGAKSGIEIKEAFEKVLKSDDVGAKDIRKLATVMGIDPDEMEGMFNEELKKLGVKPGEKADKVAGVKGKVGRDQLDDDTRDILDQAKANQIVQAEAKILEMCKKTIDKDEFFGTILKDTPEEQRDDRKDVIVKMVHRDVRGKILASPYTEEKFGTEMIQNSIQTIRSELKNYGIPSKSSKKSAISNILASLGPTGGLPAEVQSDEKIERVSSTGEDYEDNVVKRLGQKMVQSLVNKGK